MANIIDKWKQLMDTPLVDLVGGKNKAPVEKLKPSQIIQALIGLAGLAIAIVWFWLTFKS